MTNADTVLASRVAPIAYSAIGSPPKQLKTLFTVSSLVLAMLFVSSCSRVTRAERAKIAEMTRNFDGSEEARQRISDAYENTNICFHCKTAARLCVIEAKNSEEMNKCMIVISREKI